MSLFGLLDESRRRVEPVFDLVHGVVPYIPEAPVEEVVPVSELGMDESCSEEEGVEGRASVSFKRKGDDRGVFNVYFNCLLSHVNAI